MFYRLSSVGCSCPTTKRPLSFTYLATLFGWSGRCGVCQTCHEALVCSRSEAEQNPAFALLNRKRWGNLIDASPDVISICLETEKVFTALSHRNVPSLKGEQFISSKIVVTILNHFFLKSNQIFQQLSSHMTESSADQNHIFILVKLIVKSYCKIRLHHIAKQKTQQINKPNVRKVMTKMILFKNQ